MEESKSFKLKGAEQPEKMSYEQLENIAHQLSEQNRQMYAKMQEMDMVNMFKRLDYLFKVVENGTMFDPDFLNKCIDEIENVMLPKEESTEDTGEEDNK